MPNTPKNKATIIAFDTIFEQCSIAILQEGDILYTKTVAGGRGQTEIILPMLDKALQSVGLTVSDVGAWAFNRGPGAFSGIRINTALVQALSVANDAPCIGISSLLALALMAHDGENLPNGTTITAVMDARQNQVYAGDFIIQDGKIIAQDEYLLDYDGVVASDVVVGDGVDLIQADAKKLNIRPNASHIARLAYPLFLDGRAVTAENALPVYLRNNAWKTLAEQGKK
ncbi:tRNA (adenosine(37)-N6)-threonylcarbamoyltransferase complex dimerization subunit type 1 TsaB [Moraxella nasovis]|uniref:tRNA (adenosine(37)-N6)-threonylcarbamoyltransferase complex dimerization subunit type 1 TsaB n=1 Tax=Moraxella nasovis TaxID=2904121 RepID=UPI001F6023A9|nr:tRNA (adenosine(37)-N6)-threonylcarbamoyltransferase complex dimerization subunit type 1 TsaB [Moraxella nasovis]UNU73477.1 tRNA (adenosine(37)-N6)-threonylcarbamoyltransferase complex dimerization subunit type 1 TsaB [Moraxella nasovis]